MNQMPAPEDERPVKVDPPVSFGSPMLIRAARCWSAITRCAQSLVDASIIHPVAIDAISVRTLSEPAVHPLAINLVSFFMLSLVAFRDNTAYLFYAYDGQFEVSLITLSSLFVPPQIGLTNDFLHGLGNVWFAINPQLFPEYFLSLSSVGEFTNFALAYAISATELFAGTFLLGRIIGVSRPAALIAGWVITLLTFQFVGWHLIPNTFRFFPHYATVAVITTITAALLLLVGASPLRKAIILGSLSFIGITYIVIAAPTLLILGAPQFAVFGLVSLAAAAGRRQLLSRLAIMTAIMALCLAAGYAFFIGGLTSYTAANFFRNLSIRSGPPSLLLWTEVTPHFFTVERSFVFFGLLGGLWAAVRGTGTLRLAAIAFVSTASVYLTVGIIHAYYPFWFGPGLVYFENFLFPYHSIFAVLLCTEPARILAGVSGSWRCGISPHASRVLLGIVAVAIAILPWFYIRERQRTVDTAAPNFYTPHPQLTTPITDILKREIALKPGGPFRGREATLTGRIFAPSINVDLRRPWLIDATDYLALFVTGNSHTAAGLWQDSIPTLLEYNQLITPAYFVFCRFFFTEPVDQQWRNMVMMRRIDPRLLAAVGVRFIVTDAPFNGNARLRQTLDVPVQEETLTRIGVRQPIASFTLYLYELPQANLGQYSPTELVTVRTASQMLDVLAKPSTDLTAIAVTAEDVHERLVPAQLNQFLINKGYFTVKAMSSGWSVLVLPLEYSRCLHVRASGPEAATVRLFRADLLLTAVLFKHQLDAQITYHTGPFTDSRCRLEDARDMEKIEIGSAFEHRPELAPTPITD